MSKNFCVVNIGNGWEVGCEPDLATCGSSGNEMAVLCEVYDTDGNIYETFTSFFGYNLVGPGKVKLNEMEILSKVTTRIADRLTGLKVDYKTIRDQLVVMKTEQHLLETLFPEGTV